MELNISPYPVSGHTGNVSRTMFKLEVIQQPIQARASGWGTRGLSTCLVYRHRLTMPADTRRPVDPPPVIDLHVFEGSQDV